MRLSIIIVTYNSAATIEGCLKSVFDNPPNFSFEVFVVDNASTDGTVGVVKKFSPARGLPRRPRVKAGEARQGRQSKLIKNRQNLGFAGANNIAIKKARGDYIFLLNPDAELGQGALEKTVSFMEKNDAVGIVGPTIRVAGQKDFHGGGKVQPLLARTGHLRFSEVPKEPLDVDYVTGGALLIRKETVARIGPIPEGYFLYYEDADWCLRAKRAGFRVVYYPFAEVWHREGSSFKAEPSRQDYYGAKSGLIFGLKYTPSYLRPVFFSIVLLRFTWKLLTEGFSSPSLLGIFDFLRGRWGEPRYR